MVSRFQRQYRLSQNRNRLRTWRSAQTARQTEAYHQADSVRQSIRRANQTVEEMDAHRRSNAASHRVRRASQTADVANSYRQTDAASHRVRRASQSADVANSHRQTDAASHRVRRASQTAEELSSQRQTNATAHRLSRSRISSSVDPISAGTNNIIRSGQLCVQPLHLTQNSLNSMNFICPNCMALKFEKETPGLCCANGKIHVPVFPDPPATILNYWLGIHEKAKIFRKHSRVINNAVCMSSLKVTEKRHQGFSPCVIFCGKVHHLIGSVMAADGEAPHYSQIYVHDPSAFDSIRFNNLIMPSQVSSNECQAIAELVAEIQDVLIQHNPFVSGFINVAAIPEDQLNHGKIVISAKQKPARQHRRRYNEPQTTEEISVLLNSEPHDLVLRRQDGSLQTISSLNPAGMPLHFTLLFPFGTRGWDLSVQHSGSRRRITSKQFYCFHLNIRNDSSNFLFRAHRLFQEWICMAWVVIEDQKLNFLKTHQKQLRVDSYKNIQSLHDSHHAMPEHDQMYADDIDTSRVGRVILPSTFVGGPRYMNQQFQNGMAIVRKFHKPDLFITMTCNPNWVEIAENLFAGQQAHDRPDLIARVFKLKKDQLISDILKGKIFGNVSGILYVIEFQKRGLPHVHILLILDVASRRNLFENIDQFICAELPNDPENYGGEERLLLQTLQNAVVRHMIHGQCGSLKPNAPCMENGRCSKNFPKPYQDETFVTQDSIQPLYRRRSPDDGGRTLIVPGTNRLITNQNVVPHNSFLCLRYDCHINVELCTTAKAAKYLYKYVTKGNDRAMVSTEIGSDQQISRNEIENYMDLRSVGAVEAAWHIYGFSIAFGDPPVKPLNIHLPDSQSIVFNENSLLQAVENQRTTELTAFFELNIRELASGKNKLDLPRYVDLPDIYRYDKPTKKWIERAEHSKNKVIGRIHSIHPLAGELFFLRLILHSDHCKGAVGFDDLLTMADGYVCCSFREASQLLGLLADDNELIMVLEDATSTQMCMQIRELFISILVFCTVGNPTDLFEMFWNQWGDDLLRQHSTNDRVINQDQLRTLLLLDLNSRLQSFEKNLSDYDLPQPTDEDIASVSAFISPLPSIIQEEIPQNMEEIRSTIQAQIEMLTEEQSIIYNRVVEKVNSETPALFFIDARGGCGKTFLLNLILDTTRVSSPEGVIALGMATTGIASTLLHKGRTFHSRMKAPLHPSNDSVLAINYQSDLAKLMRKARILIIDECTMLDRYLLEAMDRSLRDICANDHEYFGGKTLLLAGDFRQCLPVLKGINRSGTVDRCISKSSLWSQFEILKLTKNLRLDSNRHNTNYFFSKWLLEVGNGAREQIHISKKILYFIKKNETRAKSMRNFINIIYPDLMQNINNMIWLTERAILVPTNDGVDQMNQLAIEKVVGDVISLNSADKLVNDCDSLRFNIEYINTLTPQGLPPSKIKLKQGIPLTLLRNLNPKEGLCNGTRLKFLRLINPFLLLCQNLSNGREVMIPRITFIPQPGEYTFEWQRIQFPVRPAFALTINKSQGQTFTSVGVWLEREVFSHGQLYVACSRTRDPNQLRIAIPEVDNKRPTTSNVVYKEVFD